MKIQQIIVYLAKVIEVTHLHVYALLVNTMVEVKIVITVNIIVILVRVQAIQLAQLAKEVIEKEFQIIVHVSIIFGMLQQI